MTKLQILVWRRPDSTLVTTQQVVWGVPIARDTVTKPKRITSRDARDLTKRLIRAWRARKA